MKKQIGIWIDTIHAHIIHFHENEPVFETIESGIVPHERFEGEGKRFTRVGSVYIDFEKNEERRFDQHMDDYLEKVMAAAKEADELLIFGPAQTRIKLGKKIETEKSMHKMVVVNEAAEDMTERQMIAHVRQHFAPHVVG
ncbi:MAG TPA: hypothetical protein VFM18_11575 [Methanosarcina sp.]|nr:hypothetical protein [Methanosarcina sp.]